MKNSVGTKDMTEGNTYSLMLGFALPTLLSEVFQQLYNTADAFIVGKCLGTSALAAVTSSGTLIFLLVSFFIGMSMGAGVVISRYFGAKKEDEVSRAIHTVLAFGIVSGILLTVVGVAFTPTFLKWMQTDPEVMPQAVEYFRYYFLGAMALVLYNICRSIINALGDSRRPLYYLIFSSLLNIVLDVLFLGVFGWGVWSAAAATVLSQMASVVFCMAYLLQKGNIFTVDLRKIRFHRDMLSEIVRYGLPSGVQNSVIAFANVIVQSQINSFGKLAMAAYGTHAKIEGFAFLPITSFNMACTTFISQNLGAKQYDRAKSGARFSIFAAVLLAEAIGVCYFIFAPAFIGFFDQTPGVIAFGVQQARTVALFYCLLAFSHSVAAVCRGAGKAFVPMCVMLSVWCVVRILYIIIVMRLTGEIRYIYWAYPLTWGISSVIYLIYYLRSDWVHGFEA
ncbi:MATE family efflux transporter [Roseburia sp. 1XD42-69]|uniref:MATE family efflux transporter n=1 Tax=Roseburia sp. 1XD42-69 TaxID=2320088 RepID=UPI000EA35D98|nr:MATE family efflux transporter [Roseburia sp. 1XD42-69]MCX4318212.1 MATE family efflux transporter [Lachnospiraceae bacterium]RKJ67771.1 MATE family efflux transporter [Roseburia sp. 1XD42-69]